MGKPPLVPLQTQLLSFSPSSSHKIGAAGDKQQLSKEGKGWRGSTIPPPKNGAGAGVQKANLN